MAYTTINKSSDYFNTKLYTGNGSTNAITGVGFSPSMSWIKQRNTVRGHILEDIVRGAGNTLFPHDSSAEQTGGVYLTSFDSDGFTLPSSNVGTNESGGTYASWNWKANGAGSANTDGSINSTVSVNTTAGFSIVSYTGTGANATVGHGLGSTPKVVIVKRRTGSTSDWTCYFETLGNTKRLVLNSTSAVETATTWWNSTNPSSSVFYLGSSGGVNESSQTHIAYCFAEKTGYSKFGSYTGSGNATQSPFIYTGFKPAFVIYKKSSASGTDWVMVDNKRPGYNVNNKELYANLNASEGTVDLLDFTSNGFKCRRSHTSQNESGQTYIYMAFGQSLVGSNNISATAR